MPKYIIELNGRDKTNPMSRRIVRDEAGIQLGQFEAVLTEVALLGALRTARQGQSHYEIRSACRQAENRIWGLRNKNA